MPTSLLDRYRRLSSFNKFMAWGAGASIAGLVIGVVALVGLKGLLAPEVWIPLLILVALGLFFRHHNSRLTTLVKHLAGVPAGSRSELMRLSHGTVIPHEITPEQWRGVTRDWLAFWFAMAVLCVAVVVIGLFCWKSVKERTEKARAEDHDKLSAELDATVKQLAASSERDKQLLVLAAETNGYATALQIAQPSEATSALLHKTQELITKFKATVDPASLTDDDKRRLKVADAQVLFAESRYQDVLTLTSPSDEQAQRAKTEAAIDQECQLVKVRANSLFALHQWEKALSEYERLCDLRPKSIDALNQKASCLYYLERLRAAATVYDDIVTNLLPQFRHDSSDGDLAAAVLGNYAGVLAAMGNLDDAHVLISASIDMYERLRIKADSRQLQFDQIKALQRSAGLWADVGRVDKATTVYERAEVVADALGNRVIRLGVLQDKASVLVEFGNYKEALPLLSRVIDDFTQMTSDGKHQVLSESLIEPLLSRTELFLATGDPKAALLDAEKTIQLVGSLIKEDRPDLQLDMARALNVRAQVHLTLGQLEPAMGDLRQSKATTDNLARREVTPELVRVMSQALMYYGQLTDEAPSSAANRKQFLEKAEEFYSSAITMLQRLRTSAPTVGGLEGLATALASRSFVRYRLGRRDESRSDAAEAYDLFSKLVNKGARPQMRRGLGESAVNVGILEGESGNPRKAIEMVNEGIKTFQSMESNGELDLAQAMLIRGQIHAQNKERDEAIKDFDEATRVLQSFITIQGREDLRPALDVITKVKGRVVAGEQSDKIRGF